MDKQIFNILIESSAFVQGNVTATQYEIAVQNYNMDIIPEFYGGPTSEDVNAFLRTNLRGMRRNWSIMYDQSLQYNIFNKLTIDIIRAFQTGESYIVLTPNASIPSETYNVIVNGFSINKRYTNTAGVFSPTIELTERTIATAI